MRVPPFEGGRAVLESPGRRWARREGCYGRGLGPALTLAGLHSLRERGLDSVLLYVDESNAGAVRVY